MILLKLGADNRDLAIMKWIRRVSYYTKKLMLIVMLAAGAALVCKTFLIQFYMIPTASMKKSLFPGDGILVSKIHFGTKVLNFKIPGFSTIKRNDILVFKRPGQKKEILIKRCIGLPGDTLLVENNIVYITGIRSAVKDETAEKTSIIPEIYPLHYERKQNFLSFFRSKNRAQYGPLVVPGAGLELSINTSNIRLYRTIIEKYEGNHVQIINDRIIINGQPAHSYSFKKNYYFMLGDNRKHSADSRYWGFLPEDYIIGKAVLKVFSSDPKKGIGSIQLNSLFKKIN